MLELVRGFVQAAWRTDEIRRSAPTPRDELRGGLCYFQETIFAGLPVFLRRVDSALANIGQPRLPLGQARLPRPRHCAPTRCCELSRSKGRIGH